MKGKLVAVELMTMDSEPGYVPSSGYQAAVLVKASKAAACGGDSEALFGLDGTEITEEMLSDVEHRSSHQAVLNYHWTTGSFPCPDDHVVVQQCYESICTRDGPDQHAWVVDEGSLIALYRGRSEEYKRLADAAVAMFNGSGGGIGDLKRAVRSL